MTQRELVFMPREFYSHKTHFFSPFLKSLPHNKKRLSDISLNAKKNSDETPTETSLNHVKQSIIVDCCDYMCRYADAVMCISA